MEETKEVPKFKRVYPYFYGGLLLIAAIHWLVFKDLMNGAIAFNLALAFDPFDHKVTWKDRPLWQRIWLVVHVTIGIGLIIGMAIWKLLGQI